MDGREVLFQRTWQRVKRDSSFPITLGAIYMNMTYIVEMGFKKQSAKFWKSRWNPSAIINKQQF